MHTLERVRFGAFELDLSTGELRSIDAPGPNHKVLLREQVFRVLQMLVEREGKIVTREEIKNRLWANDTVVDFDRSINATIKTLRRTLGDSADSPRYIETLARRGYRLMVTTEYTESAPVIAPEEVTAESHPGRRWRVLATLALLAVGALSAWRYEVYRNRITLAPADTIVLADVDNRTSDPVFDGALNTALRYEMEQTPYLNLLGLDKTYSTMGQMKLAPATKIPPEVARQICSDTNSKMVIADSIADAGNGYHLEIRALDCGSGAILAEEGSDISARDQVVHELGVTAGHLRRKLGEPAESLARFNQPLEKALSPSLEALQTGAEGTKLFLAGNPQAALPLYQRGIELDPDLALTYEGIGAANEVIGHFDLSAASYARAFQLRDRMTQKDRLNVEFLYYDSVTGELDKAYSVLLQSLELFPRNVFLHNNLAHTLSRLGQLKRAADVEDETARLQPSPLYFSWAALADISANRFNEARSWLAQAEALKFDGLELRIQRLRLAFIEGDRSTLDRIFDDNGRGSNQIEILRERFEAQQGHLDSADRLRLATNLSSGSVDTSWILVYSALQNAEAGRIVRARKIDDQALQRKLDRDQRTVLALSLARSGRTAEATRLADQISQEAPLDTSVQKYLVPTVRAAVKLQQHDPSAVIDLLRGTVPYDLAFNVSFDFLYPAYIRGLAYLESGDGRSAAGEFQKLIDNPGLCWGFVTGPLARLQLGRAERLMGDNASARESYEAFLNLWKDADPDVLIYRQAKAEYAQLKKRDDYGTLVGNAKRKVAPRASPAPATPLANGGRT
jgi:DNA-binding winged helix-turn-helix (wHTH) protein